MTDLEIVSMETVAAFLERGLTIGTAESLTGGMIAAALADVSGASGTLMGGIVSYDSRIKHDLLGVPKSVINDPGVVSEICARLMAEGARARLKVDVAVSATGIAGPTGGTEQTPVGTVFIGVSTCKGTKVDECHFEGDRLAVRRQAAEHALRMALQAAQDGLAPAQHTAPSGWKVVAENVLDFVIDAAREIID